MVTEFSQFFRLTSYLFVRYSGRTLHSVLNQTYPDFEVIIVDDGSTDRGIEICQSFSDSRIQIIQQANRGLPGARNTGIRHAQGDYIALLDSDDLWSPHKLDRHVAHLDRESDVGISFGYSEFIDESDKRLGLYQKSKRLTEITPDYILCRNPVGNGSSAVIRRLVLQDIEFQAEIQGKTELCYFDEHLRERSADATDVKFWLRTCITTKWIIAGIPEVLTYYRINGGGLSANAIQQLHALDRVIEKTRTYAPDIIARCESLARAYHFRYIARRLVTLGESKPAMKMLRSDWRIVCDKPRKILLTALAVYFMHYLPGNTLSPITVTGYEGHSASFARPRGQSFMNPFLQSASWLGTAELFNRVMRLGTTVIVSRALSLEDYGLSAIVLVVVDVATVLSMRTGIGSKLVPAPKEDLDELCQTAYGLSWAIAILMFMLQFSVAFPIAHWYHEPRLIAPICVLAFNTLVAPTYLIQAALVYRENQFQVLALCNVGQAFFGNLAAIVMAQMGYGLWAFVVLGILATPIWWFIIRRSQSWRLRGKMSSARWSEILTFAKNLMDIELLGKIRATVDYLLIGQVLGMEALGIYYFAFNAGLGISKYPCKIIYIFI